MKRILVLHGPNLDRLGQREPELYGKTTLKELNQSLVDGANSAGVQLTCKQSNSESTLIDYIHQALDDQIAYIIINPAAYTHTSIACRDALVLTHIPFIEVHLSNIFARESFRHQSYFSDVALGTISGLGANGYHLALNHILSILAK
ncbi:MAG: type II 3-dehydroquinate dehydratase [Gammaproteobacteria bacterium]|nr:type II 3-dehydroquinate dehydratase [Gammaproteobacteria bacterium]